MKRELEQVIAIAVQDICGIRQAIELMRPDEQFGDYATNVALQLGKQLQKNPRELAETLAVKLRETLHEKIAEVVVAGPGFLNLKLSDAALIESLGVQPSKTKAGKVVVAEYSDPNPFKILHAGHIYTTVVGDALATLFETAGAKVHRVNFSGDVGLHVGKTLWAILQDLGGENPEKLTKIPVNQRAEWLAKNYIAGNTAYDEDEQAKAVIIALNKQIYQVHADDDHDSPLAQIYWTCRQWSYESFDAFYDRLGTKLERYYPESEVSELGLQTVREQLKKGVYEESDGAVVFRGEKYGLHTRVFINSQGLPTYEAKDVGLSMQKWADYHFDISLILTDNAQEEYMAVVLKSIEQFAPELAAATIHHTHGRVKLAGGVKMSSRKGNIVKANDVLDITATAIQAAGRKPESVVVLGAIKYAFLKSRIGGDIIYDPDESVSLEGNSGPYLQYAHARARSILRKASEARQPEALQRVQKPVDESAEAVNESKGVLKLVQDDGGFESDERSLVRKITEYPEVVDKAAAELMPHYICTYLYELAQTFNRFYEHNRVIGEPREPLRLKFVEKYAQTLQSGLLLLGISAPEKM